jgi:hypothetical protein
MNADVRSEFEREGFVILPAFFEPADLSDAVVDLQSEFPTADEFHSESWSASQSTVFHGAPISRPCNHRVNQLFSTSAMCLRRPPSVIVEGPTVARSPLESSPSHFHASVARW